MVVGNEPREAETHYEIKNDNTHHNPERRLHWLTLLRDATTGFRAREGVHNSPNLFAKVQLVGFRLTGLRAN